MRGMAEAAQPITGRGIGYNLFVAGWIDSMSRNDMQKVYRLLKEAREEETIPWEWIVDETRGLERVPTWDDPEDYARTVAQSYRRDFWNQQPHRVVIWSEKGTVRGVLEPMLDKYAVGFSKLGPPLKIISLLLRAAICAPPGRKLIHGDYTAIESRTLAWIVGEEDKIAMWAKFDRTQNPDDDPYVIIGRWIGHSGAKVRKYGKIADLGFGGGVGAWKNFAPDDDHSSEEQIKGYQKVWRARHPRTRQFWYDIESAAIDAVRYPDEPVTCGKFKLYCERICGLTFLFVDLPSGRRLAYPGAEIITRANPNTGESKPALSFMDNAGGRWLKVRDGRGVWGGHLCENIVQAVARDHLAAAILRLETGNWPVVVHVHDSIAVEVPDDRKVV
jgi:hypothetical protein